MPQPLTSVVLTFFSCSFGEGEVQFIHTSTQTDTFNQYPVWELPRQNNDIHTFTKPGHQARQGKGVTSMRIRSSLRHGVSQPELKFTSRLGKGKPSPGMGRDAKQLEMSGAHPVTRQNSPTDIRISDRHPNESEIASRSPFLITTGIPALLVH